ncbi:MAG: hypothetical protein LBN23_04685 [Paludibacter sp.]|jgi:hypothetical protein|nr:hypothetical protein [Paludibacter sp.]
MKKLIFAFIAICVFTNYSVSAQKSTHEFSAYYAAASDNQMIDVFQKIFNSVLSAGYYQPDDIKYTGDFGLTYRYNISDRFAVGATALYGQSNYNAYDVNNLEQRVFMGKGVTSFTTIAAEAKLNYYSNDILSLYGFLGAGATLWNYKYEKKAGSTEPEPVKIAPATMFNFQVTPFGISVGKKVGGFAEVGFGYKGLAAVGIFVRL